MHLVNEHGLLEVVALGFLFLPFVILPLVAVQIAKARSGVGLLLHPKTKGVSLEQQLSSPGQDLVLVQIPFLQAGNKERPNTRLGHSLHGMPPSIPVVEIAHHRDSPGVGSSHRKAGSLYPVFLHQMPAHKGIAVVVGTLVKEVAFVFAVRRTRPLHLASSSPAKIRGLSAGTTTLGPVTILKCPTPWSLTTTTHQPPSTATS